MFIERKHLQNSRLSILSARRSLRDLLVDSEILFYTNMFFEFIIYFFISFSTSVLNKVLKEYCRFFYIEYAHEIYIIYYLLDLLNVKNILIIISTEKKHYKTQ